MWYRISTGKVDRYNSLLSSPSLLYLSLSLSGTIGIRPSHCPFFRFLKASQERQSTTRLVVVSKWNKTQEALFFPHPYIALPAYFKPAALCPFYFCMFGDLLLSLVTLQCYLSRSFKTSTNGRQSYKHEVHTATLESGLISASRNSHLYFICRKYITFLDF